jgi:hypothetical protein
LDEINEILMLLEDREDVLLFVPFVVFLNKGPSRLTFPKTGLAFFM